MIIGKILFNTYLIISQSGSNASKITIKHLQNCLRAIPKSRGGQIGGQMSGQIGGQIKKKASNIDKSIFDA